jgi:hypothetical protein
VKFEVMVEAEGECPGSFPLIDADLWKRKGDDVLCLDKEDIVS